MKLGGLRTGGGMLVGVLYLAFSAYAHLEAQPLLIPLDERLLTTEQAQLLARMRLHASQAWAYPGTQIRAAKFSGWIRGPGDTVLLNFSAFFNVPDATARRVRQDDRAQGDFAWLGKGATIFDDVVLTVKAPAVLGAVWLSTENNKILIVPLGGEAHAVMLLRPASAQPAALKASRAASPMGCGVSSLSVRSGPMARAAPVAAPASTIQPFSAAERNDCSITTLMAVYSPQVRLVAHDAWGMDLPHWIQHSVDVANLAYHNSGIFTTLKLVYAYEEANYVEADPYTSGWAELDRLIDPSDGYLDDAHLQRDAHMADIVVSYTTANAWYTGIADGIGTGAFIHLTLDAYYLWPTVLAHEVGHLQGLGHNGAGGVAMTGAWSTIMGWDNRPPDFTGWADVVAYFTNPLVSRSGVTLGEFSPFDFHLFEAATVNRTSCRLSSYKGPPAAISALNGDKDDFGDRDIPTRSARVHALTGFLTRGSGIGAMLDEMGSDRPVGFSAFFENVLPSGCPLYPTAANLRVRMRSWDPFAFNDAISIAGLTSSPSEQDPECLADPENCVQQPLLPVVAIRDLIGHEPAYNETYEAVLNLARTPLRTRETTGGPGGHWSLRPDEYRDLLGLLLQNGEMGVVAGDDSGVDWAELTVTGVYATCRPAGQGAEDMNGDGVVDQTDINIILAGRGTSAYSIYGYLPDPRDLDGDGLITVNDARKCAAACTYRNCAPKPAS